MTETLKLPVLPLADSVVLPGMVVPLRLDEPEIQSAVDAAGQRDRKVLVVPRLDGRYAAVGTVAVLEQVGRLPSGEKAAVVRGETRAQIGTGVTGPGAALWVEADPVPDPPVTGPDDELAKEYKALVVGILQQRGAWQVIDSVQQITDPGQLADTAGWASYLDLEHKAQLLAETDVQAPLELLVGWTKEHVAEQEVSEKISQDVREGMEKTQREFLLRQQLAAIRKELGEGEPEGSDDYRARVEAADLPEHVLKAALTEVGKLERARTRARGGLDPHLARHGPRHPVERADRRRRRPGRRPRRARRRPRGPRRRQGAPDRVPRRARAAQRRGMEKVGGRGSGAVLSLVGPPGVGKTSLGESVARALGRKFVRVALGGVRDEAEIRGHRRTYVGALPGRIVRAIREAGSMNPVVLLDEIDKVGSDYRGDPTAALLEVLDPAQNHTFRDHYLEVDLDLSDVLFLATANVGEAIPGPLADRMEWVSLDGYTEAEKVAIARDHLLPRQIERAGLEPSDVEFTDVALGMIAAEYTREAGVRQLERGLAKVLRKVTVALDGGETAPVHVDADTLVKFPRSAEVHAGVGGAHGGAGCGDGACGDRCRRRRALHRGHCHGRRPGPDPDRPAGRRHEGVGLIALSYLRSKGLAGDLASKKLHVHVPAGAVPKDGPSAGVTMTTALASLPRDGRCARRRDDR